MRSELYGERLATEVEHNWGFPMTQGHPSIYYESTAGHASRREVLPETSDIQVALEYDRKRKGLFWHRTYVADFNGRYVVRNPAPIAQTFYIQFRFPCEGTRYDRFSFRLGDRESTQDPSKSCGAQRYLA